MFTLCVCVYCRIAVLDNGRVVEYDTPAALLANKHGVFHQMASSANLVAGRLDDE